MLHRPRIAIDARYLSHGLVGGVHTYLKNLSSELVRLDGPEEYVFWIDDKADFDLPELGDVATIRKIPWKNALSSFRADQRMGFIMRRDNANLVHFPANYGIAPPGVPTIITLHDAINVLPIREIVAGHPKNPKTILTMSYLHMMTRRGIRPEPYIITVSDFSKREIARRTGIKTDRITVVHSAPDTNFRELEKGEVEYLRLQHDLREFVVIADGIKNPIVTLDAYRALPQSLRDRTSLVFFSRASPVEQIEDAAMHGECTVLLRPNRETLVHLYNLADIFVFPSWYEGFGLPVVEAMACGTPVIASDRGALPEVIGEAGIVTDAEDSHEIAARVRELLENSDIRERYKQLSLDRATTFTWQRTAYETRQVYRQALEPRRRAASSAISSISYHEARSGIAK